MSPSSLIFVVVIAIWATYLLFHVTRRREHLATARSVDRFSAHMRVLQRRAAKPSAAPAAHTSSVTLVRAVSAAATPYDVLADQSRESGGSGPHVLRSSPPPRPEMPASATPRQVAAVGINRGFALLGRVTAVSGATVRQSALLAGVALMVLTFLSAVIGLGSWWWFTLSLIMVMGVLAWSRWTATARRAASARRAAALKAAQGLAREAAAHDAHESRPSVTAMPVAQDHPSATLFADEPDGVYGGYDDLDVAPAVRRASAADVYDFSQVDAGDQAASPVPSGRAGRARGVSEPDVLDPQGVTARWEPVPVPLPTYAMKARAEHPLPVPADVPVPIEIEDDFDAWQRDTRGGPAAVNQ